MNSRSLESCDANWVVRRLPKNVRELCERHDSRLIIAGGFIRACIANEQANDIDIFSPSIGLAEEAAKELANGGEVLTTDNAFTLTGTKLSVQFIHRWTFDTAEAAIQSFDFTIARAAVYYHDGSWCSLCDERFYPDLAARRLVYCSPIRNEDAGGSMLRVLKFYQRGYRIPLDSLGAVIARLMMAVKDRDDLGEPFIAKVVTGLLREVDPSITAGADSYLPAESPQQ
jgi:hypothetical protein